MAKVKHHRLTLYVPHDLVDAIQERAALEGVSLSELTRYLYTRYLVVAAQGVDDVDHSVPTPQTTSEFFETMGRQFHRLALISVNIQDEMKRKNGLSIPRDFVGGVRILTEADLAEQDASDPAEGDTSG